MYTSEQMAMMDQAKAKCGKTQLPVTIKLKVPFKHNGEILYEERQLTYEFDARGVPCPMVDIDSNGEVSMKMFRGLPGVYLSSTDSTYQEIIENTFKPKRQWKTKKESQDTKKLKK